MLDFGCLYICSLLFEKTAAGFSFDRLGRYILNVKENESVLFTRTAEYVMDLNGVGEKVAWYRITDYVDETL